MKNCKILMLLIAVFFFSGNSTAQKHSEIFEFEFNGNKLNGLIESPVDNEPYSLIILVPGSGRTNFVEGHRYDDLRSFFVSLGISCCFWDKPGCGKSAGAFDPGMEHPIKKSADEIIAAINELRRQKVPGCEKIGLWGISRAGWVCPWVIKKYPSIAFWISVSSPDDNDQSLYQLKSNLILNGYSQKEVRLLTGEYWKGETIFRCGGSFEEYCEATTNMRRDSICAYQAGKTEREKYYSYQRSFLELGFSVDCETGRVDGNPGFREALTTITCPVLALFGEKDSQVNWRNTIRFYEVTISINDSSKLTFRTFSNCNHNMQQCKTGAREEDLSEFDWRACDGYYDTMHNWIIRNNFGKK